MLNNLAIISYEQHVNPNREWEETPPKETFKLPFLLDNQITKQMLTQKVETTNLKAY